MIRPNTADAMALLGICFCLCVLAANFTGCQSLMDRAESALECDEEVDIDLKWKIDFKDKDEQPAKLTTQASE